MIKPWLWLGFQHNCGSQDRHIWLQTLTYHLFLYRNACSYPSMKQRLSHVWVPKVLMKLWLCRSFETPNNTNICTKCCPWMACEEKVVTIILKKLISSSIASFLADKEQLAKSHCETIYCRTYCVRANTSPLCQPFISYKWEFAASKYQHCSKYRESGFVCMPAFLV